jgi:type IV secretion system protein VirB1
MIPGLESLACGPLAVPDEVMAHVVHVESSRNPFAIGVVGGRLLRQPRNLPEAVATVRMLEARGYNYSIGLAQVNRVNFERFGLQTPEKGFDPCNNLVAGSRILAECLQRHDGRWGDAFSCYYSGNPRTGYEHGYVQKVFASMGGAAPLQDAAPGLAIPLAPSADPMSTPQERVPAFVSARVSAPDARRTAAIVSDAALVPEATNADDAVARPPSTSLPPLDAGRGAAGTATAQRAAHEATPEARFLAEVKARVDGQPMVTGAPDVPPVLAEPSSVDSQQVSKRQVSDAARVF